MSDKLPEKAQEALEKSKNKNKRTITNKNGDSEKVVYRRVSITLPESTAIDNNTTTPDLALIAEARTNIARITEGETKIEELTYQQKQGALFFLNRYLNYLSSAVLLKTKFMSTSMSFVLPDNLRLDAFQKQTIIDFNQEIMQKSESLMFNVFLHHCLYGTSFVLCADNWHKIMTDRLEKVGKSKKSKSKEETDKKKKVEDSLISKIHSELSKVKGLQLSDMFRYFEKNPSSASSLFEKQILISENSRYKKLSEIYSLDPDRLTVSEITELRDLAFPLIDGLNFFEMGRALNPARYGNHLEENIDTLSFEIEIEKSELLMEEEEMKTCINSIQSFYSKYEINDDNEDELMKDEEFVSDFKDMQDILNLNLSKLVFKGYSRSWVEAHLYPESDLKDDSRIKLRNDSYQPIHIFRIQNQSLQEDLANADSLIESGIDLLNCEIRQRAHINDTKEKLVTININANADTDLSAEVLDAIVEDIATAISSGESNVLSIPEGITLEDQTEIIRASADTEKLEAQAKTNIALFFSLSTSILEDSEAQFSNTFLKIDTAQNVFTIEREAISRMIEEKVLKPAAVKAGLFCKDKQGKTVIAYPRIKFNRISIGRASEDYNEIKELVDAGTLPKDLLYEYHNTSREEVSSKLLDNALSLDNSKILDSMVNKLVALIDEDQTGEILSLLLKGKTLDVINKLRKTPNVVEEGKPTGDQNVPLTEPDSSNPDFVSE